MPDLDVWDDELRDGIARIGSADLVVGIPSFRSARTIGNVARVAATGLRTAFPDARVAIVNADGGSEDGTTERVREAAREIPVAAGGYRGPSGKGSAFHAIFESVRFLGARACAVVDSDLRSITPDWIARLLGPIERGDADYVAPLYARHKHDGTITNSVAYPLTRALWGLRVRQPIGGEFGFTAGLARDYLAEAVWDTDVARFGIDIFMTTTAIARGARVAQGFLGAKVHDPKDPAGDLGPMFTQVVGTLFRLAARYEERWSDIRGSREVPLFGEPRPVDPEPIAVDATRLRERYLAGAREHEDTWRQVLTAPLPGMLGARDWARVVFDFLRAALRRPEESERLAQALLPLYYARVAAFVDEMRERTTAEAEEAVETGALEMEREKARLLTGRDAVIRLSGSSG